MVFRLQQEDIAAQNGNVAITCDQRSSGDLFSESHASKAIGARGGLRSFVTRSCFIALPFGVRWEGGKARICGQIAKHPES